MTTDTEALRARFEQYINPEGDVKLHWLTTGFYAKARVQESWLDFQAGYAAAKAETAAPQILKGIGKINGDGWKDTTRKGQVVFVYASELPAPYSPGQYPRVGSTIWSASTDQFDFTPATVDEVRECFESMLEAAKAETAASKGRWYVLSGDGMATLCADEADAKAVAADADVSYPHMAPHRAVQLVPASELAAAVSAERERIIRECIPGGDICDPQQIADAIRAGEPSDG